MCPLKCTYRSALAEVNRGGMNVKNFPALSACRYGRVFLLKSYSLELMLSLLEKDAEGLDELRKGLYSSTPQLPAFLDYISLLESRGCVTRVHGTSKKSQRILKLTPRARSAIEAALANGG